MLWGTGLLLLGMETIARELMLFAGVGLLLGGIDEFAVDTIWAIWRLNTAWRGWRYGRATAATLRAPDRPGLIAIFVPAWDEAAVIGAMLETAFARFEHGDYRIYLGCYPNDRATRAVAEAIAAREPRLRIALNLRAGPTTKADALNSCWAALRADELAQGRLAKAIVLHDAEDVVHSAELRIFDTLIERFDLVQLPVLPLRDPRSRWVAGTYIDEFAEAHGKTLPVREAIGAGMPSAGVGCAVARGVIAGISARTGGRPFQDDCLTEDYELGLRIAEAGGRGVFVRMDASPGGGPVAVRAFFPGTIETAVRQKARWITGIALAGWDRLGWAGGLAERWMRLRDRRSIVAAAVLFASYAGLLLQALVWAGDAASGRMPGAPSAAAMLLVELNFLLLGWRLGLRFAFVARLHGWREGLRAVGRVPVSNFIAVLAARRALARYFAMRQAGNVCWDKTDHAFPAVAPPE